MTPLSRPTTVNRLYTQASQISGCTNHCPRKRCVYEYTIYLSLCRGIDIYYSIQIPKLDDTLLHTVLQLVPLDRLVVAAIGDVQRNVHGPMEQTVLGQSENAVHVLALFRSDRLAEEEHRLFPVRRRLQRRCGQHDRTMAASVQ